MDDVVWYQSNDLDEDLADSQRRWAGADDKAQQPGDEPVTIPEGICTQCLRPMDPEGLALGETVCVECAGMNLVGEIEMGGDLDISGRFEASRPGWQRLIQRLADPDIGGVLVESIDRGHRNVVEFLQFYDQVLAPRGQVLASATQDIDLSTADGRAMASVLMAFAEMESRKASERMARTVAYKQQVLGRHWGLAPFGCDRDPVTLHLIPSRLRYLLDPNTGTAYPYSDDLAGGPLETRFYHDALHELYTIYATAELSYIKTADRLNAAGWRCWTQNRANPVPFDCQHVYHAVFRWQLYRGDLPPGNSKFRTVTLEGGHDPILPVELCEAVAAAHQARSVVTTHTRKSTRTWLLSGILFCGECGQKLGGQISNGVHYRHLYSRRGCNQTWAVAQAVEEDILNRLQAVAGQADIMADAMATLRSIALETAAQDGNAGELDRLRERRERLIDLYMDKLIDKSEFQTRRAELDTEISRLEEAANVPELDTLDASLDDFIAGIGALNEASRETQKELIHSIIERVEILNGQISRVIPRPWAVDLFNTLERVDCLIGRSLLYIPH